MRIPLHKLIYANRQGGLVFPADINNDGVCEFLLLQSPGLFHASIHSGLLPRPDHPERNLFCLTAIDSEGQTLWQLGQPWQYPDPWPTHGAERSLVFCQAAADKPGRIFVIRGNTLLELEAASGNIIREYPLPYDNFVVVLPGKTVFGDVALVSPANNSYDGHSHGGPTIIFDTQGKEIFNRDVFGFGHDPVVIPDGRGGNNWLLGYEMLDSELRTRWSFVPCDPETYDDLEMHVDGLSAWWPQSPGHQRIAYAASTWLYVVDGNGVLVWKKQLVHPQQVHYGHFLTGCPEPQLLVVNKRDDLQLFDFDGTEIRSVTPEENWPGGKPANFNQKFHLFDPVVKFSGFHSGKDLAVYCEGGWPYGLNGRLERSVDFEFPEQMRQSDSNSTYRRPDDYGWGYIAKTFEDRLGKFLIVADRNYLSLYRIDK